ncbi:MAG: hypothetical protein A3E01_00350 [Gammaproteobacteria bacterium RIFCSPHIGHO2_12_FULL_63_22]|nr:MAG: hypothetical protein A3E01_00350 [Gammaproteobacteria bacterium RIFCSPHIGHO2_12_FULL_63_22]
MEQPKPLFQDTAFEESPKHKGICDFIFGVKEAFYTSEHFSFAKKKAEVIKNLVNMTWAKGTKTTKYGYMTGISHMVYHSTLDTLDDLMDHDELVTATALNRGGNNVKIAEELGYYANNVLVNTEYSKHLSKRWPYLLTYGHSPTYDSWVHNQGWAVKAQAPSVGPGGYQWTREMDVTQNRARSLLLHPLNVFGSVEHAIDEQPYKGWIKRWTLADVHRAEAMTTANKQPIYNPKALAAMKAILGKGGQEADQNYHTDGKRDIDTSEVTNNSKMKQSYIDVVHFRGPLQMVDEFRLDPNIYEVEATKNFVLRLTEQPVDLFDTRTDMMTHPYMGSPFGGTYIDPVVGHHRMTDLLNNSTLESVLDSLHRYTAYRYEDITNIEDLKNPRGLHTFLELAAGGRAPVFMENQRSGPASDALQFVDRIKQDLQRFSTTDQEAGLEQKNKTLGESQILMAASSKRLRAGIKRLSKFAIVPQVKNLVFLSLVNQTPEQRVAFSRTGEAIQMTPEHMAALQNNTLIRLNDSVTRNKYEDNLKNSEFYINSLKILANVQDPGYAVKVLRYLGKESGIKDIDEILPAPAPPVVPGPMAAPVPGQPMPGMPPQGMPPPEMDFDAMLAQARTEEGVNVAA